MHNMVELGKGRLRLSIGDAFQHMSPIFKRAVQKPLANPLPQRTGREYLLYVNGVQKKHIASRFGEVPAPLTGELADSVFVVYDHSDLQVIELAPHAKYLEGRHAAMIGGKTFRPHLAKLCNPHNMELKNIMETKLHQRITKG